MKKKEGRQNIMRHMKKLAIVFAFGVLISTTTMDFVNAGDFVDKYNELKNDSQYSHLTDKMKQGGATDQDIENLLKDLEGAVSSRLDSMTEDQLTSAVKSSIKNNTAVYNAILNQFSITDILKAEELFLEVVQEYMEDSKTNTGGGAGGGGGGGASTPKPEVVEEVEEEEIVQEEEVEVVPEETVQSISFSDTKGHWGEQNIQKLVATGAIKGYPDGTFKPNANITRGEFATVLVKAFDLEMKEGKVFNDTRGHWAKDYIATAQAHGIISGYSDTTFGANDFITREQMASMVVKAAKLDAAVGEKVFSDKGEIASWAVASVETAAANNIISGYNDGSFRPKGNATRAEAVTVMVKALNK